VRDGDLLTLRRVLADVDLLNAALSDALSSSALAFAARCGHIDVVELLVGLPGCHVDRVDRTKRSALDEAISAWAAAATATAAAAADGQRQQHDCARRYRIVRRLLAAGARSLSRQVLDVVLASALHSGTGQHFVWKLVKVKTRAEFYLDIFAVLVLPAYSSIDRQTVITLPDLSVCVSACLSSQMPQEPQYATSKLHVIFCACYRHLWQRCDTLCTSGFVDNVIFAHNGQEQAAQKGQNSK